MMLWKWQPPMAGADVDSLRQCYYMIAKKEYRPDPLKLSGAPLLNYNPNLSAYDGHDGR